MSGFTPPTRLIDYFFVIQVLDSINSEEPLKTLTYHSYPPVVDRESALRNITPFCFPGSGNSLKDHNVLFHDFVLTDERGLKRYAVCVRTKNVEIVADTDVNTTDNVINCFAVVSNQPRFNTLRACLTELLLRIQSGEGPEKFIWSLVHEGILPPSGPVSSTIYLPGINQKLSLDSPNLKKTLPLMDFSPVHTIRSLGSPNVVFVFSLLLLEKSILFHSKSLTFLARSCETFQNLLYPMQWDMVYVPVIPESLKGIHNVSTIDFISLFLDLTQAPTPFLMGGESYWVEELEACSFNFSVENCDEPEIEDCTQPGSFVRVNLDQGTVEDFSRIKFSLANKIPYRKRLIDNLRSLFLSDCSELDKDFHHVVSTDSAAIQPKVDVELISTKIRQVFLQWFCDIFHDMDTFYRSDGRFDDRKWLASHKPEDQPFLSAFSKTSMFQNFVEARGPDSKKNRICDLMDLALNTTGVLSEDTSTNEHNSAVLESQFHADKQETQFVNSFKLNAFMELQNQVETAFETVVARMTTAVEKYPTDPYVRWIKAYCYEKFAKTLTAMERNQNEQRQQMMNALNDYTRALELFSSSKNREQIFTNYIAERLKLIVSKIPKNLIESWLSKMDHQVSAAFKQYVNPGPKAKLDIPMKTTRSRSLDASIQKTATSSTDRLVLNCNPSLNNQAHIDSTETLDELSELELPPHLQKMLFSPVELSAYYLNLLMSMFKVISVSPFSNNLGSLRSQLSTRGLADDVLTPIGKQMASPMRDHRNNGGILNFILGSDGQGSINDKEVEFLASHFILRDPAQLKAVKKMPTYEVFRKAIVALRHAKLEETLIKDTDKLAFWMNIRNVLCLHVILEFGPPINFQHRMNFSYHKPVYNIAGQFYSVNEITYGILKSSYPLPTFFNTKSTASAHASSIVTPSQTQTSGSELSAVHVQTTTISSRKSVDIIKTSATVTISAGLFSSPLDTVVSESSRSVSTKSAVLAHHATTTDQETAGTGGLNQINQNSGTAKIPLKFLPGDPRFRHRLQSSSPLVNFSLVNCTSHGPRINIFSGDTVLKQLQQEAILMLDRLAECGKYCGPDGLKQEIGFNLFAGARKKQISLPYMVSCCYRDFFSTGSLESVLLYIYFALPESKIAKFLKAEQLVKDLKGSFLFIPNDSEISNEKNIHVKILQSSLDMGRLVLKIKEHDWDFLIAMCVE